MSFIEFIGFIITFSAMIFLFARKANEEKRRREDPEGYEREQQKKARAMEEFYSEMIEGKPHHEVEEEPYDEEEVAPPPLPLITVHQPIEKIIIQKILPKKKKRSKFRFDKKNLVIMYTLFGPPKALKNDQTKLFRD